MYVDGMFVKGVGMNNNNLVTSILLNTYSQCS